MFYRSKIYVTISARSFTIVPFFILNGSHLKLVKSSSLVISYKEVANVGRWKYWNISIEDNTLGYKK